MQKSQTETPAIYVAAQPKPMAVYKKALMSALAIGLTAPAFADGTGPDVSAVVQTITGGITTVSAIGLAVLSLVVTIKVFKWAQRAM